MNKLKVLFALLLLACAAGASAQDVIVKKDGSTVVCRVVEVSATEIVYKKWTDLQGSNYVMNRTDASAINYENGTRSEMGTASTHSTETTSTVVLNQQTQQTQQQLSDMQLLRMVSRPVDLQKAKRLQKIGWIGGGVLMGTGIVMPLASGRWTSSTSPIWVTGLALIASGGIIGTSCVIAGKRMESRYNSFSLWQEEISLPNGSSLMAGVDMLQDRHTNTLGLGLRYSF